MVAKKKAANQRRLKLTARGRVQDICQFLVVLCGTEPLIWRRIQVPSKYSFWDLHVAIQDAMGWLDCHLHEFAVLPPNQHQVQRFGIPDEDLPDDQPRLPSWEVGVAEYFDAAGLPALYTYDFGDDWEHALIYEGTWPGEASVTYPRCVSGARACPPEDCGGVHGFAEFLMAVADPSHPEHTALLEWAGGSYDPERFEPGQVVFDDPKQRWRGAFGE